MFAQQDKRLIKGYIATPVFYSFQSPKTSIRKVLPTNIQKYLIDTELVYMLINSADKEIDGLKCKFPA